MGTGYGRACSVRGTQRGPFAGFPPTGKPIAITGSG